MAAPNRPDRRAGDSGAWLVLAAFAACASAAFAQTPSAPQDAADPFSDVIDVRVVNLEVVVTDRDGRRIGGLGPADFRLYVDGIEMPIDYFSEIEDGTARTASQDLPAAPGVEPGEDVGTSYLVFVDDNHTRKHERDLVVEGLIDDIVFLGPHDRMAVVVHHGPELVMLTSWNEDRDALRRALRELLDGSRFGGALRSPLLWARRTALAGRAGFVDVRADEPRELSGGLDLRTPVAMEEVLGARESRLELELSVTGAVSALRGFARPPGRKVMLLVGGDWPLGSFRESDSLATVNDFDLLLPLIETANLLGYTLYPIASDAGAVSVVRNASHTRIARATGGAPMFKRRQALADVIDDTRSYYWIGFTPELAGDDVRHDVRIEVLQPGLAVRSRGSYLDLSRRAQLAMMAQSALLFGDRFDDGVEIEFGWARRFGLRKMDVPVRVRIPLDRFSTLPGARGSTMRLELRFAVIDESGQQGDVSTFPLVLQGEPAQGSEYVFEAELHMRRRPHRLLVSIHEPVSGTTLNARTEVSLRSTRAESGS